MPDLKGKKQRRGAAALPEVQRLVFEEVQSGNRSATEIREKLIERVDSAANVPHVKTIRDMIRELSVVGFEPWALADADADDAAILMPMVTEMIDESAGGYPQISKHLAEWMVHIARAAPLTPPAVVRYLANLYLRRQSFTEPTDDLDAFLAFAPWRSEKATWVYLIACRKKNIRLLPSLMGLHQAAYPGGKHSALYEEVSNG